MLRDGIPRRQIVEETSALYGIPAECVEGVVAAVPAENWTWKVFKILYREL